MTDKALSDIAESVARSLSRARIKGNSAFITTAVTYPNGTSVVVRLDRDGDGYFVSDDGRGALAAELMGGLPSFNKVASTAAKRWGVEFDRRAFFIVRVAEAQLPSAAALIANASALAVERTIYAMEQAKTGRSKEIFAQRLREAFGDRVLFDVPVQGIQREWKFDGVIESRGLVQAVFEFVAPAYNSVADAHLKIGDIRSVAGAPRSVIVLADFEKTEASLRSILSSTADTVIAADSDVDTYKRAA